MSEYEFLLFLFFFFFCIVCYIFLFLKNKKFVANKWIGLSIAQNFVFVRIKVSSDGFAKEEINTDKNFLLGFNVKF